MWIVGSYLYHSITQFFLLPRDHISIIPIGLFYHKTIFQPFQLVYFITWPCLNLPDWFPISDKRVADWPLMSTPMYTIYLCVAYLLFVALAPQVMYTLYNAQCTLCSAMCIAHCTTLCTLCIVHLDVHCTLYMCITMSHTPHYTLYSCSILRRVQVCFIHWSDS